MTRNGRTPKRTITLTDELWNALGQVAEDNHTNATDVIRQLVVAYLQENNALPTKEKK